MANFVPLAGAPPVIQSMPPTGIWGKLPLFIPVVGAIFEHKKMKEIKRQLDNRPSLAARVALHQESNKIQVCGAVRDFVESTGFFLLGGFGVKVPNFIDPVTSYLFGGAIAFSLVVIRPLQICYNNRVIALFS